MQYNVLAGAEWSVNTSEGNVSLDYPNMYGLIGYTDDPMVTLSGSDILVLDFDLGIRLHLDRIEYKYYTPYASTADVASGIEFYYKNESFDEYISLATSYSGSNIFYATTSGTLFAPRWLRAKHTIANTANATTFSGVAYGFKAFNDDTTVDFGEDGTATSSHIEIVREDIPDVRAIAIYNNGSVLADAYVNLEPTHEGLDNALAISASQSGPWTYVFDPMDLVADVTNFDHGLYENTDISVNMLRVTGIDLPDGFVTHYDLGKYTSRVFQRGNADYNRFVMDNYKDSLGRIAVNVGDPVETVETRSSNTKPKDYLTIVEFYDYQDGYYHHYRFRDRWAPTGAVKSVGLDNFFPQERYSRYVEHTISIDPITERYVGCVANFYASDSRSYGKLYLYKHDFRADEHDHQYIKLTQKNDHTTRIDYVWYESQLDYSGGVWIYFRCSTYGSSYFVDNSGYYLAYFDSTLTNVFKYYTTNMSIERISVNYTNKTLWHTRPGNGSIYLITHDGNIDVNFSDDDYSGDLGGIACLPDGNLLFANGADVHRLHSTGYPMTEYTLEDVAGDKIAYMALDVTDSDMVWCLDGSSIGLLYFNGLKAGTWVFKVTVSFPLRFEAVGPGVWVKCAGETGEAGIVMRYISKENRRVEFEYVADNYCVPGLHYQDYTHKYYVEKMPLASDNIWSSLDWTTVNLDGYLMSEDTYFQVRTTFRNQLVEERYPNTNATEALGYLQQDYFNQGNTSPYYALWGDWLNAPALDRVYIDTNENALIMEPSAVSENDAYISTEGRLVVGIDPDDGTFEIRIGYTIGDGDGIASGQEENLYIYAYSAQNPSEDNWLGGRVRIDDSPQSVNSQLYTKAAFSWDSGNFLAGLTHYEGEFAFYWNGSTAYTSIRPDDYSSWVTNSISHAATGFGDYFYVKIVHPRDTSRLKIHYITFPYGTTYIYTDTPKVSSFNTQQLIKIEDIYPNASKNVYLRSYVSRDLDVDPETELSLKVRWRIPVY